MQGADLYFENESKYKVSISIEEVCSNNSVNKRKISKIALRIHDKEKKPIEFKFDEGYWLPGNSKFVLKRELAFKKGCFKGTRKIQLDLKENFLNSINGLYLNLDSKKSLNIECPELASN